MLPKVSSKSLNRGEEVTYFGLFLYLAISLFVTYLCGGGIISLMTVCFFLLFSLGKPSSKKNFKKSDYIFDHADIDSDDD